MIWLYDRDGKNTVTFEDQRKCFSVSHDIRFGDKGEVIFIKVNQNPGAASFWYECEITFHFPNIPSWMVCDQYPQHAVFSEHRKKYYWNIKENRWDMQEIVKESPIEHLTR